MKFSYNWIRDLVPGLTTEPPALARSITMKTAECEGVEAAGKLLEGLSLARVVTVEPMAGTHNVKVIVETEKYGIKTVVCGAPNCKPGVVTAYVPVGKALIHGVESDGMLASGAELGVNRDHSGIIEGAQAEGLRDLVPDNIIEVDNKSLTHRPDLWGHFGMAREVAAIAHQQLRDPVNTDLLPSGPAPITVDIADLALCPRYSTLVFENVTVAPSPLWLQYRLEAIGLNPINNIVDVTNFVMAELAQPMHAFDADRLHGKTILVRSAQAGEQIVALNDETYRLTRANLVIADQRGPVAIAGVIGGRDSAIDQRTRRVVLESANFQAGSVRKTSVQLKLRTDASMRFEKSQDPSNTVRGLARAIALLQDVSPGIRLVGGLADRQAPLPAFRAIELPIDWVNRRLGHPTTLDEVRGILDSLAFGVTVIRPGVLSVTVPSWRATKDVSMKDDLLEEVGRMIGYDSIRPKPPLVAAVPPPADPHRGFYRTLRNMATAQGFTEVFNYSFLSEQSAAQFDFAPADHLRVANPIASDQSLMRTSLLPGIFKNIAENSRHLSTFRLFEIGREIQPTTGELPKESPHLCAALFTRDGDGSAGLFELKHLAECLAPECAVNLEAARSYEHPERSAALFRRGETIGRLFELHPRLGLDGRAAVLDLDLAALERSQAHDLKFRPLRRFPTSAFDVSVVTPLREPFGTVQAIIVRAAGADLVSSKFVREYAGPPFPDDVKSMSFRITAGASDRTLPAEEAGAIRSRVIEALQEAGYALRI